MAVVRYDGTTPVPGSVVTIYNGGTQVLATIFADDLSTPLGNPFTSDLLTGLYTFWAPLAAYDTLIGALANPPTAVSPGMPTVIFSGVTPSRTASLVIDDPLDNSQHLLASVTY